MRNSQSLESLTLMKKVNETARVTFKIDSYWETDLDLVFKWNYYWFNS